MVLVWHRWRWGRQMAFALSADDIGKRHTAEKRTQVRDAGDFEAFFWMYQRRIFSYLWRVTGNEQSAHDLSQETFLRAWKHFDTLRMEEAEHWLFHVASNLAMTYRSRSQRSSYITDPLDEESAASSDPSRRFAEKDAVRHTLMQLNFRQRAALVLHGVYGLSCEEVGQTLGISRDAAKMALWRAREQFRRSYAEEDA